VKVHTPKSDPVEISTLKGDGEAAVSHRLQTLLQLALAIGKREGLLGNAPGSKENAVAKDTTG